MDKSWMKLPRTSDDYEKGVNQFLDFAFERASFEGKISCPCKKCRLLSPVPREVAFDDLIVHGFLDEYTTWAFHGELNSSSTTNNEAPSCTTDMDIDMDTLLREAFGIHDDSHNDDENDVVDDSEQQDQDQAEAFYKLVEDANIELYPGCKNFSKLSFIVQLFHIKCLGGWSNNSFTQLLMLLKEVLPEGETLPDSYYGMKKIISKLGLSYEKIHACPNDCILYRKEYKDLEECPKCHMSRYKVPENSSISSTASTSSISSSSTAIKSKVPAKVLRYFPLIPRLQRLFMCSETANLMRWHDEERTKDGYMRHPADSPAWKTFDYHNKDFSAEPRNVRLGLASDGMNPFGNMSTSYSVWPVILTVYNLPPGMCMDADDLILSMVIPGPESPGNNIDVYLQPLIDELLLLWESGIKTYDVSKKSYFQLRAALLWTISDLPALAYLSGWSTKGKYACICCHENTCSEWLKYGGKFCYMGHRRFLERNHPFRNDEKSFYGGKEKESAPLPLQGCQIFEALAGFDCEFGKGSVNPELPFNWKKLSRLFQLPYWKDNVIRYNLDPMHLEKNVCESALGTLMSLKKSKDGLKARLDLKRMGLKPELHPKEGRNGKTILPPPCFSLNKEEKLTVCKFLKSIKVPDGYASNISRCVNLKDKNIYGLKSHDCHILIQQLLPLAVRGMLRKDVYSCIVVLSNFFRKIYSKVISPQELVKLEKEISITLCKLEKIFPPSFFDIVVHLLVHLPREARLAGPVHYCQMYPIERYLLRLKSYVRNRSQPEGCIAEAYLVCECLIFCSRYMRGVETRINRQPRNRDEEVVTEDVLPIFSIQGRLLGKGDIEILDDETRAKAHLYVLFNSDDVDPYIEEHKNIISGQYRHLNDLQRKKIHNREFSTWFENQVNRLPDDLKPLAQGPQRACTRYKKYIVNGFRFHTKEIEACRKTQNSGVVLAAQTQSFSSARDTNPITSDVTYYGILTDVIELNYLFGKKVVLFKCDWVSNRGKKQESDCVRVNFDHLMRDEEPFILASQAQQVMYVEDLKYKGWRVAIKILPRDFCDLTARDGGDDVEPYLQSPVIQNSNQDDGPNNNSTLVRDNMQPIYLDEPLHEVLVHADNEANNCNLEEEEVLDLLF